MKKIKDNLIQTKKNGCVELDQSRVETAARTTRRKTTTTTAATETKKHQMKIR